MPEILTVIQGSLSPCKESIVGSFYFYDPCRDSLLVKVGWGCSFQTVGYDTYKMNLLLHINIF